MDLYYKQEITVGGLVIAALVVLVGGLMWLTGQSFRSGDRVTIPVEFTSVQGLTGGDPVTISGVQVGRVAAMRLEEVGRVLVHLEVDKRVAPRTDATAGIRPLDFLGAKYVLYSPGTSDQLLPEGAVIKGSEETDLASSVGGITDQAGSVLSGAKDILSPEMAAQVKATLAATERAVDVLARAGSGPLVSDASAALVALRNTAGSLDSILSNPSIKESISEMDEIAVGVKEMTQGLAAVSQNLSAMLEAMRSPEGTVGKLLTDTTLYGDTHELLVSMRKLLDDVRERPGRYVHVSVF
jgi:phospholipid/cholesterol/gamma-HCH transport system substrate-binding protein